jgi:hypothetical protein
MACIDLTVICSAVNVHFVTLHITFKHFLTAENRRQIQTTYTVVANFFILPQAASDNR